MNRKFRVHIKAETASKELVELAYIAVGMREWQKKWETEFGAGNREAKKRWEANMDAWIAKHKLVYED